MHAKERILYTHLRTAIVILISSIFLLGSLIVERGGAKRPLYFLHVVYPITLRQAYIYIYLVAVKLKFLFLCLI